jgi:thiol:disulfide interchange protein DsbD
MARLITLICLLFLSVQLNGQFSAPQVKWNTAVIQKDDTHYLLIFEASIDEDWYIFSQTSPEGGSQPAYFEFTANDSYRRIGAVIESEPTAYYNAVFGVTEQIFKSNARFEQRIELVKPLDQIEVTLYYQVCKEVCISAAEDFVFRFRPDTEGLIVGETTEADLKSLTEILLPIENKERLKAELATASSTLWTLVLLGFLGGLVALFTPCVLPLIPLTVSYFNQSDRSKRLAVFYGLAIVALYLSVGIPFVVGNRADPQLFNELASHPITNFLLFLILTVFALSFITNFEITLPQRWVNYTDRKSERSRGFLSVFFMAFTLVLLSFSCTGPILGGVLGTLATQSMSDSFALSLFIVLGSFGLALAIPFVLFALFPKALQRLPKSGSWMTDLKFFLGVAELILAFKFLSNVDLVARWSLFKYEVIVSIWLLISIAALIYLISAFLRNRQGRLFRGALIGVLGLFMVVSFNALRKPVSGGYLNTFAPPLYYALNTPSESCPLGLDCYQSFEEGLEASKKSSKPLLLDFTGYSCVNCRRMESEVWSDPRIFKLLNERFIVVSLYVDNREPAATHQLGVYKLPNGKTKSIRTQGQYWSLFQALNFESISQPYYVALSPDLELLNGAIQFSSKEQFLAWLNTSLGK